MDFEQARFNMVEQQIRTWDVLDQSVLDLLFEVRREDFVPAAYRTLAFADLEIPLGDGQKMWPPKLEARVLQALALRPTDRVLEVGTGSGYFAALLGRQAGHVTSVEIVPRLAREAAAKLARANIDNVRVDTGDAVRGWPARGPYDAIVLTGSVPILPDTLAAQLNTGGRLFAVVGEPPVMTARLMVREAPGALRSTDLFETVIDPLVNAPHPSRFHF